MPQTDLEILKAPDFSDGDSTHRPDTDTRYLIDPQPMLQSLGCKWMIDKLHDAERGKFSWTLAIGTLLMIVMSSSIVVNVVH